MNKLQLLMQNIPEGLDAVVISSRPNRLYYTRLSSSAGTLFVTRENAYFIIDFRYVEIARKKAVGCEVILQDKLGEQLLALAKKHEVKAVGIESGALTVGGYKKLCDMLPGCEVLMDERTDRVIAAQRLVKDEQELTWIRQAQELTDKSFTHILNFIKAGKTEREVALELEFYSRKIGSMGPAFDFIVVSGQNSSLPHGVPSDKIIEQGDFITMDFGCIIEGYCSDMTRTVAVGEPNDEMKKVYQTVLKANRQSMAAVKAGVICRDVDKVARDIIYAAGYENCFGHGLGHALGVQVHEEPRFNTEDSSILLEGTVITIEPGVYLAGKFGCRIEDLIVVTQNGCINLTQSEKELIIL